MCVTRGVVYVRVGWEALHVHGMKPRHPAVWALTARSRHTLLLTREARDAFTSPSLAGGPWYGTMYVSLMYWPQGKYLSWGELGRRLLAGPASSLPDWPLPLSQRGVAECGGAPRHRDTVNRIKAPLSTVTSAAWRDDCKERWRRCVSWRHNGGSSVHKCVLVRGSWHLHRNREHPMQCY